MMTKPCHQKKFLPILLVMVIVTNTSVAPSSVNMNNVDEENMTCPMPIAALEAMNLIKPQEVCCCHNA